MNPPIISNIHETFSLAVTTQGSYIGLNDEANSFKTTRKKDIRLHEVFRKAQEYLTRSFSREEISSRELLEQQISNLNIIQEDGRRLFEHYTKKTNTWWRKLVKSINDYVPKILKTWFPSIFSGRLRLSEASTKDQYLKYTRKIQDIQTRLNSLIPVAEFQRRRASTPAPIQPNPPVNKPQQSILSHADKSRIDNFRKNWGHGLTDEQIIAIINDKEFNYLVHLPTDNTPNPKQIHSFTTTSEQTKNLIKQKLFNQIKQNIHSLNLFRQTSLKIPQFIKILSNLLKDTLTLKSQLSTSLSDSKDMGIDPTLIKALNHPHLSEALSTKNYNAIEEILKGTLWEEGFRASLKGHTRVEMITRKLMGVDSIGLKIDNGPIKSEQYLDQFAGTIIAHSNFLPLLQGILVDPKRNCKPCSLEVNFKDTVLTAEMVRLLITISHHLPSITLNNIEVIELKNLSLEEQTQFIAILPKLDCPKLDCIHLDSNPLLVLTPQLWGELLALNPTQSLLKEIFVRAPNFSEIPLPPNLICLSAWVFEGYTLKQIQYLLERIPSIRFLNFKNDAVTEAQLEQWIEAGFLNQVENINLGTLKGLTTDILHSLAKLPHLRKLQLPASLTKGKKDLSLLPKFEDPSKINLFYLQSAITQPYASKLYEGPTVWSSLIQIPLARSGEKSIFREQDLILDPWSTSLWLYKDSYLSLNPQPYVKSIVADNSDLITDDNILAFLQKFPEVTHLSLSNCVNITNVGILRILSTLPKTKIISIDLTDCENIDNHLFNTENSALIAQLGDLNVSGTQVQLDKVSLSDSLRKKITCEERHLKISNEQLVDPNFLETYLSKKNLSLVASLNFEGCTNLTDQALSLVLARLNTDFEVLNPTTKALELNPKRLNITTLNLRGCSKITDEAFKQDEKNGKINLKILNYLKQIIIGETQISPALQASYPFVSFCDSPASRKPTLDPQFILKQCEHFCDSNYSPNQLVEIASPTLKQLATKFIPYYIFLKLFPEEYVNHSDSYDKVMQYPIEINRKNACANFNLSFSVGLKAPVFNFPIPSEILYAQSANYRKFLRPGGKMHDTSGTTLVNQNATEIAAKGLIDLLYGKDIYQTLNWNVASHIAELANQHNFYLFDSIYQKLLKRIYSQFSVNANQADGILLRLECLNDQFGINEFEKFLIKELKAQPNHARANEMRNIASENSHDLKELFKLSDEILRQTSERTAINIQAGLKQKQIEDDEALAREMTKGPNADPLFDGLEEENLRAYVD